MSTPAKKRRLSMLPEILPAPERVLGRPDPRARVLERVRQLSAAADPAAPHEKEER